MESLQKHHTFGLPVYAQKIITISRKKQLIEFAQTHKKSTPLCILGKGSNSLFLNNFNGVVVLIKTKGYKFYEINKNEVLVRVNAGEDWGRLAWRCSQMGLWGCENLVDIPASVGAAVIQNIGAYGQEIKNLISTVEYFNLYEKKFYQQKMSVDNFGYRESVFKNPQYFKSGEFIITKVELLLKRKSLANINYPDLLKIFEKTKNIQPINIAQSVRQIRQTKLPNYKTFGNAGSFFKNIIIDKNKLTELLQTYPLLPHFKVEDNFYKVASAWLIENAGLKGFAIGDVMVSPQHALVLGYKKKQNRQEPQPKKVLLALQKLINHIQKSILNKYGLQLQPEVIIYKNSKINE